jgi:hypothetical protein
MSKEALAKVVQRAISDASFRRQLGSDTAGALRGFDLTPDEVSALRAGEAGRLSTLGVDQRMSKSFALGGMAAATLSAQSDLTAGSPTAIDDGAAGVGRTIIPHDPEAAATKDLDGGPGSNRSAIKDDPDGFLAANAIASGSTGSVRTGDDWKYADKSVAQGSAAPVEGSPEATAAEIAASGGGRIGSARLDDASGSSSSSSVVNDDPDGFLAANKNADFSGGSAVETTAFVDDSQDTAYLPKVGYDASAASANASTQGALETVHGPGGARDPFANADASGGSAGDGTAFLDESEAYWTRVADDSSAETTGSTRATWSGDENAGPASVADDDGGASPNATESGPNITP